MRCLVFFSVFLFYFNALCSFELTTPDAIRTGCGQIVFTGSCNAASFTMHPALLGSTDIFNISFSKKTLYGITALKNQSVSMTFLTQLGGFGFAFHQFGNKNYSETTLALAWGAKLIQSLNAGILLNYHQLSIKNYGVCNQYSIDISVIYKLEIPIQLYTSIQNLTQQNIKNIKGSMPVIINPGIRYCHNKQISLACEYAKEINYPAQIRYGIEIKLVHFLILRSGCTQSPETFTLGFRLKGFGFLLDYGLQSHRVLGQSHCITITF